MTFYGKDYKYSDSIDILYGSKTKITPKCDDCGRFVSHQFTNWMSYHFKDEETNFQHRCDACVYKFGQIHESDRNNLKRIRRLLKGED